MKFSSQERKFLKDEFGYTEIQIDNFSKEELSDVTDKCFDVEVEEAMAADGGNEELSERGILATDIVTRLTARPA